MSDNTASSAEDRYNSAIVTITVGTDPPMPFHIHESILVATSSFFKAALNKRWIEGKSKEVSLPDDEVGTVASYIDWLYTKETYAESGRPCDSKQEDHAKEWTSLSKLYVLAEKIQDDECCDAVMQHMIKKVDGTDTGGQCWYPTGATVATLYNGTLPGAPVRRFLVETHKSKGNPSWIKGGGEDNHVEFMIDLARALLGKHNADTSKNYFSSRQKQFLKKE